MKSILFLNRVYPPSSGATGQLLADLGARLVGQGWKVTVVTGQSDNTESISECQGGVRVERVRGLPFTRRAHWKRALSYLFLYPALLWRALRLPTHDVIVTMTDPPLQCMLGPVLKKIKGGRLIHWAQDIYPELAEELGVLNRGGWLARALRKTSTWALRRHEHIIAVGQCMKEKLIERGLDPDAISVIPNWGHAPAPADDFQNGLAFRRQHGLKNSFVVMYSGNLGLAHPMEAIFAAAKKVNGEFPEIVFVMIGDGPKMSLLKSRVEKAGLGNVRFLPPRQRGQLAECLAAADVHLACMHTHLLGLVVPSKVYGVLATGRPCLFLGPEQSEVARLIRRHRCGAVLDPDDNKGLADQLVHWFANREQWQAALECAEEVSGQVAFGTSWARFQNLFDTVPSDASIVRLPTSSARPRQGTPDHVEERMPRSASSRQR